MRPPLLRCRISRRSPLLTHRTTLRPSLLRCRISRCRRRVVPPRVTLCPSLMRCRISRCRRRVVPHGMTLCSLLMRSGMPGRDRPLLPRVPGRHRSLSHRISGHSRLLPNGGTQGHGWLRHRISGRRRLPSHDPHPRLGRGVGHRGPRGHRRGWVRCGVTGHWRMKSRTRGMKWLRHGFGSGGWSGRLDDVTAHLLRTSAPDPLIPRLVPVDGPHLGRGAHRGIGGPARTSHW